MKNTDASRLLQRASQRAIVSNHRIFNGKPFDAIIDVVFTVIHHGDTGKLTQQQIENQVQILQDGFDKQDADSGFTFWLQDIVFEDNEYW